MQVGARNRICDYGGKAAGIMADVGDPAAVVRVVKKAEALFGTVDISVSNVAIRHKQPFLDISVDDWNATLNSNLSASFYLARAVIPGMKARRWGRIIHISGVDGFAGDIANRAHNIVCKTGVHALSKALSLEFTRAPTFFARNQSAALLMLGRVDGFNQNECARQGDERTVIPRRLLAS
jgi:NAD(P)-dependent dehydrogenase (short-subunit alcohol dehydrogenase family)